MRTRVEIKRSQHPQYGIYLCVIYARMQSSGRASVFAFRPPQLYLCVCVYVCQGLWFGCVLNFLRSYSTCRVIRASIHYKFALILIIFRIHVAGCVRLCGVDLFARICQERTPLCVRQCRH